MHIHWNPFERAHRCPLLSPLAWALLLVLATTTLRCSPREPGSRAGAARGPLPPLLLITLDTTRADALGFAGGGAATPSLDALAARGVRFDQAYTVAPQTLTAHASMLTGRYPNEHGLRENGRYLANDQPLLAAKLAELGYRTAAFVSGFPLARGFGLARGFETYDDDFGKVAVERSAAATTERALAWLQGSPASETRPPFLWVHYYDPHDPYEPPEPFRSRYKSDPYLGEIAAMDHEFGRLLDAWSARFSQQPWRVIVVGDHGEGRGEQGEEFHGHLLYRGAMQVPLLIAGHDISPAVRTEPVSVRRVFDTLLEAAGSEAPKSLLRVDEEIVLGEAMMPFLSYGWQPQAMAITPRWKVIRSGVGSDDLGLELYDLADRQEANNLAGKTPPPREALAALAGYLAKLPGSEPTTTSASASVSEEDRRRLASLGYAAGGSGPPQTVRADAPHARTMTAFFVDLETASKRFGRGEYSAAIPILERVLTRDPGNATARLRLAVAHSVTGNQQAASALFAQARRERPESIDVRHYEAMHRLKFGRRDDAAALFESVLAAEPARLPALEALAQIRGEQGNTEAASELLARVIEKKRDPAPELIRLGQLRMTVGDTPRALAAFERARGLLGDNFRSHLELGVLYLDAGRFAEARVALDRVPQNHPAYAMALFKRAQLAYAENEPDRAERLRLAKERADAVTRPLIEREALFGGAPPLPVQPGQQ